MSGESSEYSQDTQKIYPSEKIFTLPEFKTEAYGHIYDRIVSIEGKKAIEGLDSQVYNNEILKSIIYEYFGSLIRVKPTSLGLPEKVLLPSGEKSWRDIPFEKTSGDISIESIISGETRLLLNAKVLQNLRIYWGMVGSIAHSVKKDAGDFSHIKSIRLLQDDNESFRMGLRDAQNDKIAKHGKSVTSILRIEYDNGTEKLVNLTDSYKIFTSPKTEKDRATLAKVQQERRDLKDSMNREPLFGGSLSYEYVLIGGVGAVGASFGGLRMVNAIRYRTENGTMIDIKPETPIRGTKEQIIGMVAKEMETWGNMYNRDAMCWENILEKARKGMLKKLPEMSVSEMNTRTGLGIHTSVWDKIRENPEKHMSKLSLGAMTKKGLRGILQHGILFPLDVLLASEVATYSNNATVFSASSDLAAFYLGQKSLDFITKFVPGGTGKALKLLRFPAGVAATVYSNKLWKEALEGNKKKWQYLYQNGFGSMYTDGQSTSLNMLGGGFVNFSMDQAQKNSGAGERLYDIGATPGVLSVFGKNLDIPEVNFFQHKIDLATDPGDWLRGQSGRTIDDWNDQIDHHLSHNILQIIQSLIGRMEQSKYPFTPDRLTESKVTKEEMLTQTLNSLLSGGNDPSKGPVDVKGNILFMVEKELKGGWKGEASMNKIAEVVYTQVPKLKIDSFFTDYYYPTQILFHQTHIGTMIGELAKNISPQELTYIQTLQERMEKNLPLCEEGRWVKTEVLGMSSNKFVVSETNTIFQGLLENKKPIKAVLDINPKSKSVDTTVGEYFAYVLNFLLEQKRRKEFYNEIQKGNKSGVQWTI